MKVKRFWSVIVTVCMLVPLIFAVPASAATEWEYEVSVTVSHAKGGECKKGNAINVKLTFDGNDEEQKLQNTGTKGGRAYAKFKTTRAPWTLDRVEFANSTKDSLWIYRIYIDVNKSGRSNTKRLLDHYPGDKNNNKSGMPIDQDDGGPKRYAVRFNPGRTIYNMDNFVDMFQTEFYLDPKGESGTLKREWSGKISDDYTDVIGSNPYYCMDLSDAPTLDIGVYGIKGDKSKVSKADLEKNGVKFLDRGYEVDKAKLTEYMNKNNINALYIDVNIDFPVGSTRGSFGMGTETSFFRKAFSIESVNFGGYHFNAGKDNYFYNNSRVKLITVTGNIKTSDNYSNFENLGKVNTKILFDRAYIKTNNGAELDAVDMWGNKTKSAAVKNGKSFDLVFPYPAGTDSENSGITLVFENAVLSGLGEEYKLWDEQHKRLGFANQDNFEGYLSSVHKIDAKEPTVNLVPASGVDLNKWNKTVTFSSTASEDIYAYLSNDGGRTQGFYTMRLTDGTNSPSIYKYNYTEQNKGTAATSQTVPALKNYTNQITLALRDKVEGTYDLVLSGQDFAGNTLKTVYKGIKLDNKAPEVTISEKEKPKTDGKKGMIYNVKISDASGTGRLYYMFTKKSLTEIPAFDGNASPTTSGEMDTTLDKWAYIEQKDTEGEKSAAAYLDVEKGQNFIGRMVYFAVDDAGNKTEIATNDININNEDTTYDITPKNVDKARPSYNITIDTNENNTVRYCWKNYITDEATGKIKENYITKFKTYSGGIDTAKDDATKKLNGTYILECEIVPPSKSKTSIKYISLPYAFDNAGPEINITPPSEQSYKASAVVGVYATDVSDVGSATAKIVTPDGKDISGNEEFSLSVVNGILSQNVSINNVPSGAYALKVTATDTNGTPATEISKPFYIRSAAPEGTVDVASDLKYNEKSLLSNENIKLSFDITESFANPSYAKDQSLYYRVSTTDGDFGEWIKAGEMSTDAEALKAKLTVDAPQIGLVDGENTLFVQTAVCHDGEDKAKISLNNVKNDEVIFYYDQTAPTATLVINDVHTSESISGKLYVNDNFDSTLTAKCQNGAVEIGELKNGAFDITVSENVDTTITVSDSAKNKTSVKLIVKGIDRTAPDFEITTGDKHTGARLDATATVTIKDVSSESVRFAFIPKDKYREGEIPSEYFRENSEKTNIFKVSELRAEESTWDGEKNITYNVEISGETGEWYLGVRAADSLGNSKDIVFNKLLKAEDAELTAELTVSPMKTEKRTVASIRYNVPVYTLPQDKIVDEKSKTVTENTLEIEDFEDLSLAEKVVAANLELAKQYALTYSDKYTFGASENGKYELYTADDLGRTKHFTVEVKDVEFGAASDIKAERYKKEWPDPETYQYIPIADGKMICAASRHEYVVIIEPTDSSDTLLLPNTELDSEYTNGLRFDEYSSADYAVYEQGAPVTDEPVLTSVSDTEPVLTEDEQMQPEIAVQSDGEIKGYTKLIYRIEQIVSQDSYRWTPTDDTERIVTVRAFNKDADTQNPDEVSEKTAVITDIDNTAPIVDWTVDPEVLTLEAYDYNGEVYYDWAEHPTPGNVTYTLNAQDKESGIEEIIAAWYNDENDEEQIIKVPMTDKDGNATEYWCWDGSEHKYADYEYDEETQSDVKVVKSIPVKIEYFGDGDKFGIKTLKYTFTDVCTMRRSGIFINTLEAEGYAYIGRYEGSLSTDGLIYKMPIEEETDYNVAYYFENSDGDWELIDDTENTYYKNAKAVIEIPEGSRGEQRGLYVVNNSGSAEKLLDNYRNTFSFTLKDKYGYTKEVPVSLENFDIEPGTVEYTLSNTEKTNKPIDITINVSDEKSGIGSVKLTSGSEDVTLSANGNEYKGKISQNGTYSITLYDRVGNKTVKSFNIKNINTQMPIARVTYSTEEYTSRPVTATIDFSKPNVRITNISPIAPLTEADYSVNYNTSVITFAKSGTVAVCFEDDYGNSNADDLLLVAVGNIDKTPPMLEAVLDNTTDPSVVAVTFNKVDNLTSKMDMERKESEIYATYGGITKSVADADGNKNSFVFYQNGNYTFKVHDKEGLSSYLSLEVDGIDNKAPKITSISWSYDYDEFDGTQWVTKSESKTITPTDGKAGYIVNTDQYKVTNKDVTVTVETDDDTRLVGSNDLYNKIKEKIFDRNGLFIFNTEKKNGLTASYGVDIEVIDKTPPTIDLLGNSDLVFYENPKMNAEYDISMLKYVENGKYEAYKAYDVFKGKKSDLTKNVEVVDWGGFDPSDLSKNTFDSSKPYTIKYRVTDAAHNVSEAKRTIRLVGMYDTVALVNGALPDFAGRSEVSGDSIKISLANFSGTAYVRYQSGVKTMGEMKKDGTMIAKNSEGDFEVSNLKEGWYTFYIQTDKRDYFTLNVYLSK